jgi:hypothetical protein
MTVGSVGGMGSTTGVGQVSHDVGDIAFMVALLEVETLDTEIGGRLTQMQHLNAIRKAYNQRIAELQELIGRCDDDGNVEAPTSMLQRGEYVWDPAANDGAGGVVLRPDDRLSFGNGSYQIRDADGTYALVGEVRPVSPRAYDPAPVMSDAGCTGPSAEELAAEANRQPFRTRDRAEAERIAAERGGQAVTTVSRDDLRSEMEALRDKADTLSSDAEIGMLGLNRLLSRRNQVLQLASNVMSSQHQTTMGIIANLKV